MEAMEEASVASIWGAIRTIIIADAVMSLDNVIAIAAAANGNILLIGLGLAMSVPLIIYGSTLILNVFIRYPILIVAGAALIGWIAGEIWISDPAIADVDARDHRDARRMDRVRLRHRGRAVRRRPGQDHRRASGAKETAGRRFGG